MINTWPGWESVRLIGEGSFGSVYEIRREEFGFPQRAALKVITIPKAPSDVEAAYQDGMDEQSVTDYFYSFVEELVAEFALMYQLKGNNTNIVSYEDHMVVQHDDGIGWDILIRMELLTPLTKYVSGHPLTEEGVIRLGMDMCSALEICREKGVIHRDIKPENIFYSDTGHFKLGDFGVARVAEKTMSNFSQKGTYNYMAPEVYRRAPYGFSVDIYSLGIVLYRFLNYGRLPFLPEYPDKIYFSDREKALERRMSGREALTPPKNGSDLLKSAVLKACAYQPEDRYQTPKEFLLALQAAEKEYWKSEEKAEKSAGADENMAEDIETGNNGTIGIFSTRKPVVHHKEETVQNPEPEPMPEVNEVPELEPMPEVNEVMEPEPMPEVNEVPEPEPMPVDNEVPEPEPKPVVRKGENKKEKPARVKKEKKPKAEKQPKEKPQRVKKVRTEKKPKVKVSYPKMPIVYRILGFALPILVLIIAHFLLYKNGRWYNNGFSVYYRVPFNWSSDTFWDFSSEYFYLSVYWIPAFGAIIAYLTGSWLFCTLLGNLLETTVCGRSHLLGSEHESLKRTVRIAAAVIAFLLLLWLYTNTTPVAGLSILIYLIIIWYEFKDNVLIVSVCLIISILLAWLICRLIAGAVYRGILSGSKCV